MQPPFPKREIKKLYFDQEARDKLRSGAHQIATAVGQTYGPSGTNVILGMPYGDATLTRDGVTVAKRVILKDHAEDYAAQILRQASEKTNRTAGDGTTATIVLAENLYRHALRMVEAGDNPMVLKRQLVDDSRKILDFIKSKSVDAGKHLKEVATVSAGDENIGALVADLITDLGPKGGITLREQDYPVIDVEKVNGYYFDRGFFAVNGEAQLHNPHIFVCHKQINTNADIVPLLNLLFQQDNKVLVIIGEVRPNSEAMNTIMLNNAKHQDKGFVVVVIPPPAFGEEGKVFMDDIAAYVGAELFMEGNDPKTIIVDGLGKAETVKLSQDRAVIFRGGGSPQEIVDRAAEIRQMADKETSAHRKDQLEQRFAKLTGKVAIVNVGASTLFEMEELRYRVEDAIEATKSAAADGILPGGASVLVQASKLDISPMFRDALRSTFKKLMDNAAEDPGYRLKQLLNAKFGWGFNLRAMTEEPIDLTKNGVWDATQAVLQTVENATSAAGSLLTAKTIVAPIEEDDSKSQ